MPGEICDTCGRETVEAKYLVTFELVVAGLFAESGLTSTPEAFHFMRHSLGMTAVEMASLFGVTPETVSRWENGKLPIETRSLALLGCMVMDAVNRRKNTMNLLHAVRSPTNMKGIVLVLDGVNVWADVP